MTTPFADTMPAAFDMEVQRARVANLEAQLSRLQRAAERTLVALTGGDEFISLDEAAAGLQAELHDGIQAPDRVAELESALRGIANYDEPPFDWPAEKWAEHTPETCKECKEWRDRKHPIQHSCEGWYSLYYERERRREHQERCKQYRIKDIARAALGGKT